MMAITGRNM